MVGGAVVVVPRALEFSPACAVGRNSELVLLLTDVEVSKPRRALAHWILINDSWGAAFNLRNPDAIRFVNDASSSHSCVLSMVLDNIGIASSAFTQSILISSGGCVVIVSAKSDTDFIATPVRCDFVVPAVSVGLPVLLVRAIVIIDVVEAEIIMTTHEVLILVDTAAFWGRAFSIWLLINTTSVTHGSVLLIDGKDLTVFACFVEKDVFVGARAFLGVTTTSKGIVVGHPLWVKCLGLC